MKIIEVFTYDELTEATIEFLNRKYKKVKDIETLSKFAMLCIDLRVQAIVFDDSMYLSKFIEGCIRDSENSMTRCRPTIARVKRKRTGDGREQVYSEDVILPTKSFMYAQVQFHYADKYKIVYE